MAAKTLEEEIDEIPGEGGWEKVGSRKDFLAAARRLMSMSEPMSQDDAIRFLCGIYSAVADCYGC